MLQETSYTYDAMGNRTSVLDSKGQKIEYDYNAINRLVQVRYYKASDHSQPVKVVDFTYDKLGNLETYADGTTSAEYTYDDLQRKTSESVDYGPFTTTIAYDYYANGLTKTFTGPDGVATDYFYDDNNRLSSIALPGQGRITYNTYQWNSPTRITLPGGSVTDYQYDPLMRIKSITASDPGQNARMTRDYTYSPNGNIVSKNTEHGAYTYDYDSLNRLTEALNPQGPDEAYTYDALGNRSTSAEHTDWNFNTNNELQGYGDVTFAYDNNGNTVQKATGLKTHNYIYDVEDRLVSVEDGLGNTVAQYYYDPFGWRLWKDVDGARTYFVYSDEGLIGEYDATGSQLRSYGWAPQSQWSTDPLFVKQDGNYYWYLNDHLGTPQQIIDTSGKVVWSGVYDSFGNCQIQTADILNNLRFAGQYHDAETGLYYNLNRYYDPSIGRYLRTDPFGEGLNLYAYVFNNPNSLIDPLGLCVVHPILAGLGFIPIVGNIPDLIDAAWYLLEGNEAEAAIAAAAAIPIAGLVARGGQYLYKFGKWLIRSEKVKDFLQNSWKIVNNQIGAVGDIQKLKNTPRKTRKTDYPHGNQKSVRDTVISENTDAKGNVIDPETGAVIPKDQVSIEHKKKVVEHWNEEGYNKTRKQRREWYNDESNLTVKPKSVNSSEGAASKLRYRQDTGPDYSN